MNTIFLGRPPASIEAWIKRHPVPPPPPPVKEETVFWVDGVEQEPVMIEGALDQQWFIDHGYWDDDEHVWLKPITKAELGSKVTSIGNYVFSFCTNLTSVSIPSSVTEIGDYAFESCTSLDSITIPNSVTSIGNSAFSFCINLTSVSIPNSVTEIDNFAFINCESLTSVSIPSSVTEIGDYAFESCANLATVYVDSENEKERVRSLYAWPETVQFEVKEGIK